MDWDVRSKPMLGYVTHELLSESYIHWAFGATEADVYVTIDVDSENIHSVCPYLEWRLCYLHAWLDSLDSQFLVSGVLEVFFRCMCVTSCYCIPPCLGFSKYILLKWIPETSNFIFSWELSSQDLPSIALISKLNRYIQLISKGLSHSASADCFSFEFLTMEGNITIFLYCGFICIYSAPSSEACC